MEGVRVAGKCLVNTIIVGKMATVVRYNGNYDLSV